MRDQCCAGAIGSLPAVRLCFPQPVVDAVDRVLAADEPVEVLLHLLSMTAINIIATYQAIDPKWLLMNSET